ncbi:MAG: hypothetical protein P8046_06905 [Anaerolineales bacterium]
MRAVFYSYHLDEAAILQLVLQRAGFSPQQVQQPAKIVEVGASCPRRAPAVRRRAAGSRPGVRPPRAG